MKEKVILLFKIPSDHLEICNPVIYDVREIFFDEPNKNEKARKKLITSNVSHVQNTMSKISTIVNICYKKKTVVTFCVCNSIVSLVSKFFFKTYLFQETLNVRKYASTKVLSQALGATLQNNSRA